MTNTWGTEVLVAGAVAGAGMLLGIGLSLSGRKRSRSSRASHLRKRIDLPRRIGFWERRKLRKAVGAAHYWSERGSLLPSSDRGSVQSSPERWAEWEAERKLNRERQHAAFLKHKAYLVEGLRPDETAIQLGDMVTYAFCDAPERHITVLISFNRHDPDHRVVPPWHPFAEAVLGRCKGEDFELSAGGAIRSAKILDVSRPDQHQGTA